MDEKKMVTIPYEDFAKLMRIAGRVEAALDILRSETGIYVKCPDMIAILTGDAPCGAE